MPRPPEKGRGLFQRAGAPDQTVAEAHQGGHRFLTKLRVPRAEVDVDQRELRRAAPFEVVR